MDTPSTSNTVQLNSSARRLLKRSKHNGSVHIAADCFEVASNYDATHQEWQDNSDEAALVRSKLLDNTLDILLNPVDPIDDLENLNWLRSLMASGKTPTEFECDSKT